MGIETRRLALQKKKNSPPILSHEFVIQNHGDITSVILMVVFIGFMFPATTKISSLFVLPQYNETVVSALTGQTVDMYRNGLRDLFAIIFYSISCVTVHAVIQEYILDKIQRKVHLSKTKQTKFSESGQLLVFSAYSVGHAVYVLSEFVHELGDVKKIWLNYPEDHVFLSLRAKIFFIVQLAYWLHQLPEFYLQKLKKEEIYGRLLPFAIHFFAIGAAYAMNFQRLALVVLALEYTLATLFHIARLAHFLEKKSVAGATFRAWNIAFVIVRVAVTVLSVIVFWHGLRQTETPFVDVEAGNFNTSYVRLNCLIVVLLVQLYQLWNFVSFHIGRWRESRNRKQKKATPVSHSAKNKKKAVSSEDETDADSSASPKQTPADKKKKN